MKKPEIIEIKCPKCGLCENSNELSMIDYTLSGKDFHWECFECNYEWTGNYKGATCGWESSVDQFNIPGLSQKTKIKNLYLTGHCTTITLGIPGVTNIGKSTADLILQK